MKILLRSCLICQPADTPELFLRNFLLLQESGLGFDIKEDNIIWTFVKDFVLRHRHVPDVTTVQAHFERVRESEVVDRLKALILLPAKTQGDFKKRLEDKAQDRRVHLWSEILKEAGTITNSGMVIKEGKGKETHLQGPVDAARYILQQSHRIVAPTLGSQLSGEITADGVSFLQEYERVEADPLAGIGQFTGLHQMDVALAGAKKFELWIHAAFTGGLKSTFMLNWAYNQAIYYKHDSCIFSLEMPYSQCRRILYAIHSIHEKFKGVRHKLGIQKDPNVSVGLNYQDIRDGRLTPAEREFLFRYVVPDFNDEKNEYGKIHIEVADPDKNDFTVLDLRSKAELLYSQAPFALLFVDHVGLMQARQRHPNTSERLNEVLRDLKRLAMGFNRGAGMAVVSLFQINRQGYKDALKKKEKTGVAEFDLTHLSYANEAERSADIVTATWVDEELRKKNRVQYQNLKSRDQAPFEKFLARVEWPCRRLFTCYDVPLVGQDEGGDKTTEKLAESL